MEGSRRVHGVVSLLIEGCTNKTIGKTSFYTKAVLVLTYIYVNTYSQYICMYMYTKLRHGDRGGLEETLIHAYTQKGAMIMSDVGLEGRTAWRWSV